MTVNALLTRWAGGWTERSSASSIASVGRIEGFLNVGSIDNLAEVQRVADAQLDEFARTRTQTDVTIEPIGNGDVPYKDFTPIGANVTVEGVTHRILGMTVTEDNDTGKALFLPTLNDDIVLEPDERVFQALRKMVNGTLGGRSKVAQPVVPIFVPRAVIADTGPVTSFTESFDKANSTTIGPDITWTKMGDYTDSGLVDHFGNVAGEVFSNQFTINRNAAGDKGASCWIRAASDLGTEDMAVQITITGVAPSGVGSGQEDNQDFEILARVENGTPANASETRDGTIKSWSFGVTSVPTNEQVAQLSVNGTIVGTYPTSSFVTDLFAAGDIISIEVTGQREQTRVVGKVNGAPILTLSVTDDAGSGVLPDALAGAGLTYDDLPSGTRGAVFVLGYQQTRVGGWDAQRLDLFDDFVIRSL